MGSPNPLPEDLVVNLGSNIFALLVSEMPVPLSAIRIETYFSSEDTVTFIKGFYLH